MGSKSSEAAALALESDAGQRVEPPCMWPVASRTDSIPWPESMEIVVDRLACFIETIKLDRSSSKYAAAKPEAFKHLTSPIPFDSVFLTRLMPESD